MINGLGGSSLLAYIIEAAMRDKDTTRKQAAQFVKTLDGQLMKWTRFLYGVDWQDPSLYDVVLSLDRVSVDGAAETIAAMTELGEFRPTGASHKAFADLLLSSQVWSALTGDARTHSANIRVAADGGEVFITGSADNAKALDAIAEVAGRVAGVTLVDNEVGVGGHWQL